MVEERAGVEAKRAQAITSAVNTARGQLAQLKRGAAQRGAAAETVKQQASTLHAV